MSGRKRSMTGWMIRNKSWSVVNGGRKKMISRRLTSETILLIR